MNDSLVFQVFLLFWGLGGGGGAGGREEGSTKNCNKNKRRLGRGNASSLKSTQLIVMDLGCVEKNHFKKLAL